MGRLADDNSRNVMAGAALLAGVVGVVMLPAAMIGVLADVIDVQAVILVLSLIALTASGYIFKLKDVSG